MRKIQFISEPKGTTGMPNSSICTAEEAITVLVEPLDIAMCLPPETGESMPAHAHKGVATEGC